MAFTQKVWTDRQTEFPRRRKLTATGAADVYDISREEGTILVEGYNYNAENMNDLETRIKGSIGGNAVTFTLYAASWTGTSAPYSQTVSISGVLSSQNGFTQLSQTATTAQSTAHSKARIRITAQATGQITFVADGTKPTVDLPMTGTLLG